jgi:hypothetical protein
MAVGALIWALGSFKRRRRGWDNCTTNASRALLRRGRQTRHAHCFAEGVNTENIRVNDCTSKIFNKTDGFSVCRQRRTSTRGCYQRANLQRRSMRTTSHASEQDTRVQLVCRTRGKMAGCCPNDAAQMRLRSCAQGSAQGRCVSEQWMADS